MINRITAALLLASLSFSTAAQEEALVEDIREFNVEVIIFAYAQDVSVGTEIFVPDQVPVAELEELGDQFASDLEAPPRVSEMSTDAGPSDIPDFTILTDADLTMRNIADRMRRLDVYDVLLHAGWTQAARPKDESITMRLDMLTAPPENLSGEFTLYLSRFLHLVADLELDAPGNPSVPVAIEQPRERAFDRPAPVAGPVHYRIQEDRIFRSDETRYYDHPKFGIVARVTPYEPPEPVEALPGSATAPVEAGN